MLCFATWLLVGVLCLFCGLQVATLIWVVLCCTSFIAVWFVLVRVGFGFEAWLMFDSGVVYLVFLF